MFYSPAGCSEFSVSGAASGGSITGVYINTTCRINGNCHVGGADMTNYAFTRCRFGGGTLLVWNDHSFVSNLMFSECVFDNYIYGEYIQGVTFTKFFFGDYLQRFSSSCVFNNNVFLNHTYYNYALYNISNCFFNNNIFCDAYANIMSQGGSGCVFNNNIFQSASVSLPGTDFNT